MDKEKLKEVNKRISRSGLKENMSLVFMGIISNVGLSEKKMNTFLKLENNRQVVGFLFRFLISTAYEYGVPSVYIKECTDLKKVYEKKKTQVPKQSFLYRRRKVDDESVSLYKERMTSAYTKLLFATYESVKTKKSRKEKISRVLERISEQKSNQ